MSRQKTYWISQITGWLLLAILNISIIITFEKFAWPRVITSLYLSFCGLSISHIFRHIIKNRQWLQFSLKKLIPRVVLSSVIMGAILFIILSAVNLEIGRYTFDKIKFGQVFFGTLNLSLLFFIWALIYFSVHFFENYKKAEIESLIWEAAVKDFELKTLKSQLNPHFMFNAMNSIRALIEEDPNNAKIALTKLSNILRYSLKIERNETVKLESELKTVEDYLLLESIRFEERLKYKINVEPDALQIEIPPMMVQTLVENGIKHGISKVAEGGSICLDIKIKDSKLIIDIKNTGTIKEDSLSNTKGYGISNTIQRLRLLYGEEAGFKISNINENEVLSELIIPIGGEKNESINN